MQERKSEKTALSRHLRLGYFVECFPTFVINEITELRNLGAKIVIFNAFRPPPEQDPLKESFRQESVYFPSRIFQVVIANVLCALRKPLVYAKSVLLLKREDESLRMLLLAAWYARLIRKEGIEHLHGTFGTRTTTLAAVTAQLAGIGYSFTTHAYDIFNPNPSLVWKTNHSSFMRTISEFNKRYIEKTYGGVHGSRICVNYLGVDLSRIPFSQNGVDSHSVNQIISVGDLFAKKGHDYLIRACAMLRDRGISFECKIIGDGPERESLASEIERLGLSNLVQLLGALDHEKVLDRIGRSHIFALACIDLSEIGEHVDGIPVALMEAMAVGIPVISTSISGIPELIENGVSGMLIPEKNETALATALIRLMDDSVLREKFRQAARKRIEQHFDLTVNTQLLAGLFSSKVFCEGKETG